MKIKDARKPGRREKRISRLLNVRCSGCGACCSVPVALVNDADLRRLARGTGITAERMVTLYGGVEFEGYDRFFVRLGNGRRIMALKKRSGRCIFLSRDSRCTVYEHRPLSCRLFPLQAIINEDETDIHDLTLQEDLEEKIPCRHGYGEGQDRETLRRTAVKNYLETEAYLRKVARWNTRSCTGGKMDFLSFIGLKI